MTQIIKNIQYSDFVKQPPKTMPDAVATDLFSVQVGSLDNFACIIKHWFSFSNGVDIQSQIGNVSVSIAIKAGLISSSQFTEYGDANSNSAGGAINDAWTANLSGTTLTIRCNANNSLNVNDGTLTIAVINLTNKVITYL